MPDWEAGASQPGDRVNRFPTRGSRTCNAELNHCGIFDQQESHPKQNNKSYQVSKDYSEREKKEEKIVSKYRCFYFKYNSISLKF